MHQEPPKQFPFEWWWKSFDLGKYRPCDGTYCSYPYESLPPIDETQLTGKLEWLGPPEEEGTVTGIAFDHSAAGQDEGKARLAKLAAQAQGKARLAKLVAQAQQLGLTLPEAFLQLMASPELQDRIPSCTACYLELSEQILPCPGSEGGSIIRFLHDQQDVVLWHLYLTPQGEECVLASGYRLDALDDPEWGYTEEERNMAPARTMVCAPSFEAFLYRFWLENTIWHSLHQGKPPLTETQWRYLAHYEQDQEQNVAG